MRSKCLFFAVLFWSIFFKSQIADEGYPLLYQKIFFDSNYTTSIQYRNNQGGYMPIGGLKDAIPYFETEGANNQRISSEIEEALLKDANYANQNIYGKSFYKEINIVDDNNRIEYDGRYYYLYKIKSSDAKAIQIYFKKYRLSKDSKLFFYNEDGFILGEFNDKNNPNATNKGLEFGIQPIPGNTLYIELSYPVYSTNKPTLITEKLIHSINDFYGGVYGTAGNCHKNVVCEFTGNNDQSRNIKSVGMILYPIYINGIKQSTFSAMCSGNLINNTKQDGAPYFLTAAHCIGVSNTNNIYWKDEVITLFNYEAKTCTSNGSDAPSNNSVKGCDVLTESPQSANDFALLKLTATPIELAKYKICYAGWDNNPNSYSVNYTNAYGIHHPNGDTKKISYIDTVYPVISNEPILQSGLFGYYSVPYQLDLQGTFLQNSWRSGIVEKGSSGSPLFNSYDRLIGSLSTGPKPDYFNCSNPDIYSNKWFTYYSRFSSNFLNMSPWLNPNGTNVQTIGPYCPSTPLVIGAPIIIDPGIPVNPGGALEELSIDINGKILHPSNTWGKKIYLNDNRPPTIVENINEPNTNYSYVDQSLMISNQLFAASANIYNTSNQQVINKFELWGIYKIIGCNKLKYIKPAPIVMKNPGTVGQLVAVIVDVVAITDNYVHILIREVKRSGNGTNYISNELQTFKVINDELLYVSYQPVVVGNGNPFDGFNRYNGFNNNRLMLERKQGNQRILDSYFFNESNNTWMVSNNVMTLSSQSYYDVKILEDKAFVKASNENKISVYNFAANSPNLTLQTALSNIFLGNYSGSWIYTISKKSNNEYWLIYNKSGALADFTLMTINLLNNSVSHPPVSDDFKYVSGEVQFIIRGNEIIRIARISGLSSPPVADFSTHQYMSFINSNGSWVKSKTNYLQWKNVAGYNSDYLVTLDVKIQKGVSPIIIDRTLSIREFNYITHPYTMYNDMTLYSSAYHRPKKLDHYLFDLGTANGKTLYKNIIGADINYFPFRGFYDDYNYNTRTLDVKTVILDNKTDPIVGNEKVYVYGKYSVVIKPGFSVSSVSGAEFHAIPQEPLPGDIPTCSFTFDDMLNPKITETPNESLYLRQTVLRDQPYYGEIILNGGSGNSNHESIVYRNIKVYPNPTKDILYVDFNSDGKDFNNLEVYSGDAKKIITKNLSSTDKAEINLSQYPTGIYILKVTDKDGKSYPYKIIKK
ncbi:T9SS type A sorting domain-containing protein [Chryseobacterium sp. LAM-KRS1]|uniref:T9SS type A sorting domain-containing protein n=1 Tax=Chryseobacterium sp. LAM-KRS1 TaxID=2715754 RepID=UPI00155689D6|nr:T9SS type A sorting domain-containing protein [Chryseobacterium sp. LAM-KRS1]